MRFVGLSHPISNGMVTYPGLPGPVITDHLSRTDAFEKYDRGTSFQIGRITMVSNTGTYIDSPFHRYADGSDLGELDLAKIAHLRAVVCRVSMGVRKFGPKFFSEMRVEGRAELVHTGWDTYWGTGAYFDGHPFLTREAAQQLSDRGAVLVDIDSMNIDDTDDGTRPAHTILFARDISVVEHLCGLDLVPDSGFYFYAVPVKVKGLGSFPVRAFGLLNS